MFRFREAGGGACDALLEAAGAGGHTAVFKVGPGGADYVLYRLPASLAAGTLIAERGQLTLRSV